MHYVFLLKFKVEFSEWILEKNTQINSIKLRPMGAEFFHADGQTDMTKPVVAFRNFANSWKMAGVTGVVKVMCLIAVGMYLRDRVLLA